MFPKVYFLTWHTQLTKKAENKQMNDYFRSKRALKCIMSGKVISLAELRSPLPLSNKGSGFAVLPLLAGTYFERFMPATVQIVSPTDGVVTATEAGCITLRTGDGVLITVSIGTDTELLCTTGTKIRGSEPICAVPRQQLLQNGMYGAVSVMFCDSSVITELHVISGIRKAGYRTAFYRILPPK